MRPSPLLVPLVCLGLAGCAEMIGLPPPVAPAANAVAQASELGGRFIAFVGPRQQHAPPFLGVPGTNYDTLRSWLDTGSGEVRHQIYVEDSYIGAKREYDAAHAGDGTALTFVPISSNEIACDNGCSYAEEFAAVLPEALLRSHAPGLTVVFSAKNGPVLTIVVPGDLIAKQLAAVDAARAVHPAAAAAR